MLKTTAELKPWCSWLQPTDRTSVVQKIRQLRPDISCKSDSSLDHGFEMVSQPATLEYHKTAMGWEDILKSVRRGGFHPLKTCGMHVHVDKKRLPNSAVLKLQCFLNLLPHKTAAVACREKAENNFEHTYKTKDIKGSIRESLDCPDRYMALNVVSVDTYEFRIFASTLNPTTLFARLEFVAALCSFGRTNPINVFLGRETWRLFQKYVTKEQKAYPLLIDYLKKNSAWEEKAAATKVV